jgi:hypothetical protein
MKTFMPASMLLFPLLMGCAHDHITHVSRADFHSKWIDRELNYYTSHFSSCPTNHFYVGAVDLDHGQLVRALVYWKEERTILEYSELADDAPNGAEALAWRHGLKLDRDTVDTPAEIAGSTYLETHRQWVEWMEECIMRGKQYCVVMEDARRMYPVKDEVKR